MDLGAQVSVIVDCGLGHHSVLRRQSLSLPGLVEDRRDPSAWTRCRTLPPVGAPVAPPSPPPVKNGGTLGPGSGVVDSDDGRCTGVGRTRPKGGDPTGRVWTCPESRRHQHVSLPGPSATPRRRLRTCVGVPGSPPDRRPSTEGWVSFLSPPWAYPPWSLCVVTLSVHHIRGV